MFKKNSNIEVQYFQHKIENHNIIHIDAKNFAKEFSSCYNVLHLKKYGIAFSDILGRKIKLY